MGTSEKEMTTKTDHFEVTKDIWGLKTVFVNVYFIALNQNDWILVDAGLRGSSDKIKATAAALFGRGKAPKAVILTHGHFDHVGTIEDLLEEWNVPVYAHELELPYLKGGSAYPPPDPLAGGGLMSLLSVTYPRGPINLGDRVHALPKDGSIPELPEWVYVHTPGHSPGHVSLFRSKDSLVIAGDAFVTTKQESAMSVAFQAKRLSGPPKYFTNNWAAARTSVKRLRGLHPKIAATGHGKPMYGQELSEGLDNLVANFDEIAVPSNGRYVNTPARANRQGVVYVPPRMYSRAYLSTVIAVSGLLTFFLAKKLL